MQALESGIHENRVTLNYLEIFSFSIFVHYKVHHYRPPIAHVAHILWVNRFPLAYELWRNE